MPSLTTEQLLNMRDGNDLKTGKKLMDSYKESDNAIIQQKNVAPESEIVKEKEQNTEQATESSTVTAKIRINENENDQQTKESIVDFDLLLKQKTDGKFEKWDDLIKTIENQQQQQPYNVPSLFPDEQSRKIYEYIKDGKIEDVASFLNAQLQLSRLDAMDDETKIKTYLRYNHPTWSEDDIKDEYDTTYGALDSPDSTEARRIRRQWKEDAAKAYEYLQGKKSEIKLPELPVPDQTTPQLDKQQIEKMNEYRKNYLDSLKSASDEFKGYSVKVKDDDFELDASFNVPQSEKNSFFNDLENFDLQGFFENNYFSEGKYNTRRMAEDMWLIQRDKEGVPNFQKIMSAMLKQVFSEAKLSVMSQFKGKDKDFIKSHPADVNNVSREIEAMISQRV